MQDFVHQQYQLDLPPPRMKGSPPGWLMTFFWGVRESQAKPLVIVTVTGWSVDPSREMKATKMVWLIGWATVGKVQVTSNPSESQTKAPHAYILSNLSRCSTHKFNSCGNYLSKSGQKMVKTCKNILRRSRTRVRAWHQRVSLLFQQSPKSKIMGRYVPSSLQD